MARAGLPEREKGRGRAAGRGFPGPVLRSWANCSGVGHGVKKGRGIGPRVGRGAGHSDQTRGGIVLLLFIKFFFSFLFLLP